MNGATSVTYASLVFGVGIAALVGNSLRRFLDLPARWPTAGRLMRWLWVPGLMLVAVQVGFRWVQFKPSHLARIIR